jgi:hypothetical protein
MAVEVMDQACTMAGMEPADVAVVFSSSMGDMEITDYMCRALAGAPKVLSPTRFHNSVHNAAAGYWSIANGAFSPASAVSAFEYTASMALLEAAIQAVEEHTPVILVTQELAAPPLLLALCPSQSPFSAAFLLAPPDKNHSAICSLEFSVSPQSSEWPPIAAELATEFMSNFGARLLPVLTAIATDQLPTSYQFPISEAASLHLALASGRRIG